MAWSMRANAKCARCVRESGFFLGVGASDATGRVGDVFAADAREGCELVKIGAGGGHDVSNGMAADGERVGDERAMAAPRNSFGAHDGAEFCAGSPASAGKFFEARESSGKFRSLHVVGETAKAGIVPSCVDGIGAGAAQTAEFWQMRVGDARGANGSGELVAIELRIVARFGDGADVDEALDIVRVEESEKFVDGMVAVANRENECFRGGRFFPRGFALHGRMPTGPFAGKQRSADGQAERGSGTETGERFRDASGMLVSSTVHGRDANAAFAPKGLRDMRIDTRGDS